MIGKSLNGMNGFKPREPGDWLKLQLPSCPYSPFDGSMNWVIAYYARGRGFDSRLRLQAPG